MAAARRGQAEPGASILCGSHSPSSSFSYQHLPPSPLSFSSWISMTLDSSKMAICFRQMNRGVLARVERWMNRCTLVCRNQTVTNTGEKTVEITGTSIVPVADMKANGKSNVLSEGRLRSEKPQEPSS